MNKIAAIITNGNLDLLEQNKKQIMETDFIVCVDGAASILTRWNIQPHVLLGDLDSINLAARRSMEQMGVPIQQHPVEKDQTDTELALHYCTKKGFSKVLLFGALGSRLDHSLANVLLCLAAQKLGLQLTIFTDTGWARLVGTHLSIQGEPGDLLSLLPLSECVSGVTLDGMKYPLDNASIHLGTTRGISNELSGNCASVSVTSGDLLAIFTRQAHA
ncbi:thiamine diphosphokinase [Metallumcola ferriviriculae]|uniref:Thiamine diphosphokinase n=1 Tax=Metallumcola ferriviriculae TaxID=3039180 RepID=A0AAU0UNQ6_9FIRM|nr:thiamine diphosphokinase [Desulfitibacteraceae bacterium MK1]